MFQKLAIVFITCILLLGIWQHPAVPQHFANADVRVSSLQSQVYQLRAEVSQLRNQVYSLNRSNVPTPIPMTPVPKLTPPIIQRDQTNEQMFDRLATLVIELKERLNEVEARLAQLENQPASSR